MNIIFIGAPGAGKGTQAEKCIAKFDLLHLSSGDLLRENLKLETELGLKAKVYMDQGELVPDNLVIKMIEQKIKEYSKGCLFDGFPRTLAQAKALDELLSEENKSINAVIHLDVEDKSVLIKRLQSRGRKDDKVEVIEHRLNVFDEQTKPLVSFYRDQDKLCRVNSQQDIEKVWLDIETFLKEIV